MDHEYLAANDGSEQAAGRGSGIQRALVKPGEDDLPAQIPYMHMVYAPIERRLDNAIFRALFASSARQARQFVVHGYVKVNGKKVCRDSLSLFIELLLTHWSLDEAPRVPPQPGRYVPSRPRKSYVCDWAYWDQNFSKAKEKTHRQTKISFSRLRRRNFGRSRTI